MLLLLATFAPSMMAYGGEPGGEDGPSFNMDFLNKLWPVLIAVSVALCVFSIISKCFYRYCQWWNRQRTPRNYSSPRQRLFRNQDSVPVTRTSRIFGGLPSVFPTRTRSAPANSTTVTPGNRSAVRPGNQFPSAPQSNGRASNSRDVEATAPPPQQPVYGTYGWAGGEQPPSYHLATADAPPPYARVDQR